MSQMRVAVLHNYYQRSGGEDTVFHSEVELLRSRGHEVLEYTVSNESLRDMSLWRATRQTIWNPESYRKLRLWFEEHRPDVAHFHNIAYVLSPSAYQAAFDCGVAVVQTLHNYRLICLGGLLLRNGKPCELCVGRSFPYYGLLYGCYRGSRSATLVRGLMLLNQKRLHLWERAIFVALTEFAREKFIQGGLPADKVVVKPNFVSPDPGEGAHQGNYALFVGRLTKEKGIEVMLQAWAAMPPSIPLKIVGDGPLAEHVQQAVAQHPHIEWLGHQPHEKVLQLMQEARLLVFPSICYENMSLSLVEAMATGLPAIASGHGSMASMIRHGETGWLFEPGNPEALRRQVQEVWNSPEALRRVGQNARAEYLQNYTPERNYEQLIAIYERAIQMRKEGSGCGS
ncbi:MAG: glycosyl transferase family 1 [Fimbriimonadales bacterium]|nr:MAG: glycosyl transferase family 1 [Fimbriimonadales bacterium]